MKKQITAAIFILALLAFIFAALDSRLLIRTYILESEKITQPVRIALITDLHSCFYSDDQMELIEAIRSQDPDLVLLGGDICDDKIPNDNTEALLKGIADQYPCFYVTGNHEYWSEDIDAILELFQSYGVTILNGNAGTLEINGQKINLCGVPDPDIDSFTDTAVSWEQMLQALSGIHQNGYYTILLSHRPERIESYLNYDFDLILSGHAHGGQWRIPGILNGLFAPNQGLFPKYAGGEYRFQETTMIVSRGLARESTPLPRIFNRPELVIVDLL